MSDNETPTRFNLELPGLDLAISGDKKFVEDLYGEISRDLIPVLNPKEAVEPNQAKPPQPSKAKKTTYTWVYGCTAYYNKVYVVDDDDLRASLLGPHIEPTLLRRIYVDRDHKDLFTSIGGSQKTLWAEFTEEGRELFQAGKEIPDE